MSCECSSNWPENKILTSWQGNVEIGQKHDMSQPFLSNIYYFIHNIHFTLLVIKQEGTGVILLLNVCLYRWIFVTPKNVLHIITIAKCLWYTITFWYIYVTSSFTVSTLCSKLAPKFLLLPSKYHVDIMSMSVCLGMLQGGLWEKSTFNPWKINY